MGLTRSLVAMVFALTPVVVFGQAGVTGTITGRIVDSSGAVVPGASVTLKSPEALGEHTTVTDSQGLYRIQNLQPATYDARAELQGFQTAATKVTVRLGATTEVNFTLSVGSMSETVTVSAEAPIVDPERTGVAVNINNTALTTVPISTNRRYQDVWGVMPGVFVRPDTPDSEPSVNSRGTSENNIKLDGMHVTDPYGGAVTAVSFNFDAIEDMQVKTLGREAEDSAGTGGVMAIVTKSGGNSVHGTTSLFLIPQPWNSSNVANAPPNQRKEYQPNLALGGPIDRDRIWFFGAYRRIQQDATANNAPVPKETRGNLVYGKVTTQVNANQRLAVTFQYDATTARYAVLRGASNRTLTVTAGLNGSTPQISAPSAFGTLITGGPLAGVNYTWVPTSRLLFQFAGNWMTKPQNQEPSSGGLSPTKIVTSNPQNNIAGSLTTISQEGSYGQRNVSERTLMYLNPSLSFNVSRWGSHDFKAGVEFYPVFRNKTTNDDQNIEFWFRPPGTTGGADVLYEVDSFRNLAGTGSHQDNEAHQIEVGTYFQDRWKVTSNVSIKAGFRVDHHQIYTKDRNLILSGLLPPGTPTNTADQEVNTTFVAPNFGIAWNVGRAGVFRATAGRYSEWLDLGGSDGTSHLTYVTATDVTRANPRSLAPSLNQSLPGGFALPVAYNDPSLWGKTYKNEYSAGWEKTLPNASSFAVTFVALPTHHFQGSEDVNVIRDPATGAFLGRPFPQFNNINRTGTPEFTYTLFRSIQFLYTKNFAQRWGMNANYWYGITSRIRNRFNPTSDTLQFLGVTPAEDRDDWVQPRHQARLSSFVRLPYDFVASGYYSFTSAQRSDVLAGALPLNATAPTIVLSNGRAVADPFFNPAYYRGGRRGADMIATEDVHTLNLRAEKVFKFAVRRELQVTADVFNLFNNGAAFGFLSADSRSANFAVKTNIVPPRVGQLGIRFAF